MQQELFLFCGERFHVANPGLVHELAKGVLGSLDLSGRGNRPAEPCLFENDSYLTMNQEPDLHLGGGQMFQTISGLPFWFGLATPALPAPNAVVVILAGTTPKGPDALCRPNEVIFQRFVKFLHAFSVFGVKNGEALSTGAGSHQSGYQLINVDRNTAR